MMTLLIDLSWYVIEEFLYKCMYIVISVGFNVKRGNSEWQGHSEWFNISETTENSKLKVGSYYYILQL